MSSAAYQNHKGQVFVEVTSVLNPEWVIRYYILDKRENCLVLCEEISSDRSSGSKIVFAPIDTGAMAVSLLCSLHTASLIKEAAGQSVDLILTDHAEVRINPSIISAWLAGGQG